MRTGLAASTVTPGRTAPEASRTTPVIAACANAAVGRANMTKRDAADRRESGPICFLLKKGVERRAEYAAVRDWGRITPERVYLAESWNGDTARGLGARVYTLGGLVSRNRSSLTYSNRGIPPRCVAHRSLIPDKLALRALRSGRRGRNICHRTSVPGHYVCRMRGFAFALVLLAAAGALPAAQKAPIPRTSDGHPDLEGNWSYATLTTLERPAEFKDKPILTVAEAAAFEQKTL